MMQATMHISHRPRCTKTVQPREDGDPGDLPGLRGGGPAVFR